MYLKDKTLQFNIRISEKDKEKLDFLCCNWGCTRTDMVRHLINYSYNNGYLPDAYYEGVENDK